MLPTRHRTLYEPELAKMPQPASFRDQSYSYSPTVLLWDKTAIRQTYYASALNPVCSQLHDVPRKEMHYTLYSEDLAGRNIFPPRRHYTKSYPCVHFKGRITPINGYTTQTPVDGTGRRRLIWDSLYWDPTHLQVQSAIQQYSIDLVDARWQDAYTELIDDACGQSAPLLAVPNFIIELPQALSLFRVIPDMIHKLSRSAFRDLGRRTLKETASTHLAYSFGLAPLLSDLYTLFTFTEKWRKEVERFEARIGAVSTLRKAVHIPKLESGLYSPRNPYSIVDSSDVITADRLVLVDPVISSASANITADVTGSIKSDKNDITEILVLLNQLSITSPFGSVWEGVPFSFVFDWFTRSKSIVDKLDAKIRARTCVFDATEISNMSYSLKYRASYKIHFQPSQFVYGKRWNACSALAAAVVGDHYIRGTGEPPLSTPQVPSGFDLKRTLLGFSLATQKLVK